MKTALFVGGLAVAAELVSALTNDAHPDCKNGPLAKNKVCDMSADPNARAKALVSLFTLQEKFNNTGSVSPGVPRIGLPPYGWWQEALHGVASSPGVNFSTSGDFKYATSFPEPITMGAAFDDDLIKAVATVISTEARAFNNANRSGLDFWTPNINPFKDPRWGRGQETPGEDPYHLSSYVKSLIDGLQGGKDPKYKRIVATCKHFVGYDMESWNGNYRYQWDAPISMQDLVEYYTPSFKACVDANVGAFMCSYNAANGVPSCSNSYILQDILREHWGWTNDDQWVTSDCDAVQNVYLPHEWKPTRAESVAASLKSGVDLNCGTYFQHHLPDAYAKGLITEKDVDTALIRLYSSLVRLGYFDSDDVQPYRKLAWSDVNTPNAQKLAYDAAAEGIVLLKNDGTLPLKNIKNKTIGMVGSWANATAQLQGNYFGVAPYLISPLAAAQNVTKVLYAEGPGGQGDPTTNSWLPVWQVANKSDIILYIGGIDNTVESEGMDRTSISWTGAQLDMIGQLADLGKPMVVAQMGGGQIDSSPLKNNKNISALLWGGYPGQSGGQALIDIITGKVAPAGRLPTTQYPAHYIADVPMTDMSLRPGKRSPGRTYKWYTGEAVYPFGAGMHYTKFSAKVSGTMNSSNKFPLSSSKQTFAIADMVKSSGMAGNASMLDGAFTQLSVDIMNTGNVTSDYVALLYLAGNFGPKPHPIKSLVSYTRAHNITGGSKQTVSLPLTLGSLGRVDKHGNTILHPGDYSLILDNQPLLTVNFTLTGKQVMLDRWPQPHTGKETGVSWVGEDYFVGGYGSEGIIASNTTNSTLKAMS